MGGRHLGRGGIGYWATLVSASATVWEAAISTAREAAP